MRPTGLGHAAYKDVPDYSIFCGEWCIGRIYETAADPRSALVLGAARTRRTRVWVASRSSSSLQWQPTI
jgi:hypothetical protein